MIDAGTKHPLNDSLRAGRMVRVGDMSEIDDVDRFDVVMDPSAEIKYVWCLVARFAVPCAEDPAGKPAGSSFSPTRVAAEKAARAAKLFSPGDKVYCFPPVRDGDDLIKVIGRRRGASDKFVSAEVAIDCLEEWRADRIKSTVVMQLISPPWDKSDVSRDVANGLARWKAGGDWPTLALRQWNRKNVTRQVGPRPWHKRLGQTLRSLFNRD